MTWGTWGSSREHRRYMQPIPFRRKCRCGCDSWATHTGMANGVALMHACELTTRRWVKYGDRPMMFFLFKPKDDPAP